MPILFKTVVKQSQIHGLGLYAAEDIPAGSTWWINDETFKGV